MGNFFSSPSNILGASNMTLGLGKASTDFAKGLIGLDSKGVDYSGLTAEQKDAKNTYDINMNAYYNAIGIDPLTGSRTKDVSALTSAQTAQVEADRAANLTSTNQFLSTAGLADSTMAKSAQAGVQSAATIEAGTLQQQNLQNALAEAQTYSQTAMTALGISSADLRAIYSIQQQELQAQQEAFTGLLKTAAMIGASAYTGGAAAPALSANMAGSFIPAA